MVPNRASNDHQTFVETLEPRVLLSTLTVTNANDSGAGSLRQAIADANAAAGADVIEFDASLNGETIVLTSGSMQITDDLTITGPGSDQLTIDGNDLYRIFENDATTTVSGLLLTQGYTVESGGAIYNSATLTLQSVTITGCYSGDQGGAIYSTGGALTIDGATIDDNSSFYEGGGVAGDSSTLSITDTTISRNYADDYGGGIFTFGGTLTLNDSTISNNSCSSDGGGIANQEGILTITGSSVSGNIAGGYGGGLTSGYGEVSIADSSFSGNSAGRDGGGIENQHGIMSMTDSSVTNNTADRDAGGIYNYRTELTVADSTVSGNSAGNRGGGVTNWGGPTTITDSTISDNIAVVSGGGIWQATGVLVLVRTTVTRGTAASGGGIDNKASLTLIDSLISECTATDVGGGIRSYGDPDADEPVLTLINSVVTLNTASSGGGIGQTDGTLTITGSSITSNTVTGAGGGVSVTGGTLTVTGSSITSNTATGAGGGVSVTDGTLDIAETTLSGNEAANGGGLSARGLSATIARSTISNNTATAVAGGLGYETTLTVTNSTISGNTADLGGGIVGEGTTTIANCTITGNISADEGLPAGGLAIEESAVTLRSSIIANNATAAGTPSDIALIDSTLVGTNNLIGDAGSAGGLTDGVDGNIVGQDPLLGELEDNGGPTRTHALLAGSPAIGAGSNPFDLTTDQRGSVFSRGTSVDIGAYQRQSLLLLVDTDGDDDDGDYSAGNLSLREAIALAVNPGADAISLDALPNGSTITLVGGSLAIADDLTVSGLAYQPVTISGGGASGIFTIGSGAVVTLSGLTLTGGAASRGAAIDNAGDLTLEDMVITGNTATDRGGAIANDGSLAITSCSITDNAAEIGGAIANTGTLTISLSAIDDNSAGSGGGAIDNEGGATSITRSSLTGNTAGDSGGAIWTDSELTVSNSTISGNSAGGWGGGIGMYDGTVVINNSTIAFNVADTDGDGLGQGGGIDVGRRDGAGTLTTTSTIYAGNTRGAAATVLDDISLTDGTVSGTNNLVQDAATAGGLTHGESGNLVGVDPGLGSLAYNGSDTKSHAIFPSSPAIDSGTADAEVATDQRGLDRVHGDAADIGAFEWQPTEFPLFTAGGSVESASQDDNSHSVASRNINGDIVVFRNSGGDWIAERLADHTDAPGPFGTPLIWTDPADGLIYVAASCAQGFLLFQRDADGIWTSRNLSTELGLPDEMPYYNFTQFVTTGGLVSVAGYNADRELILLQQSGDTGPDGAVWSLRNLSDDLTSRGMVTPDLAYITSYVTPWNQWTIAGIDLNGDIQGIWVNIATFTTWRTDNLSDLYGTPTLSGQLTVIQTSWKAINLAGTDADGNVIVTWWVPSFKGSWAVSDLTESQGGTPLASGRITGWVTSWGAMNFAGLDSDGEVVAYWWTPGTPWTVSTLTGNLGNETDRPTSSLDSHVSDAGTMNIVGTDDDTGNVLRLWWTPDDDGRWKLNDLTELAVRT